MQFYKIRCSVDPKVIPQESRRSRFREKTDDIVTKSKVYNFNNSGKRFIFLARELDFEDVLTFGLIIKDEEDIEAVLKRFFSFAELRYKKVSGIENTLSDTLDMLNHAENRFDYDMSAALSDFSINVFADNPRCFREFVIDVKSDEDNIRKAEQLHVKTSLLAELDRIAMGKKRKRAYGIPCTYLIESDDIKLSEVASTCIMRALYNHGRIRNKRFTVLRSDSHRLSKDMIEKIYYSSEKGTVIVDARKYDDVPSLFDLSFNGYLYDICEIMNKQDKVQTIFLVGKNCEDIKADLINELENETLVEITEDYYDACESRAYLEDMALKSGIGVDKQLFAYVSEDENYYPADLDKQYKAWFKKKLKTAVYPQYRQFDSTSAAAIKEDSESKAYSELQAMIGLENVKNIIDSAINYNKAQKLYLEHDMPVESMSRHMLFTGNPGTAKTTVARLFASIMKDNKILPSGQIVEVGRGDLVGKFVGSTALIVKRRFKEARGGVLFIDEAYSLVDDRDGLFGDEAINTIVQEMENHRNDVIVIFAGYPDKMEGFLKKNPGLSSRIAFHVQFEDYTPEQLCEIADLIAGKYKMKLEPEAREKLRSVFDKAVLQEDFGNGRFVRNIIEKTRLKQAQRLMSMDIDDLTDSDLKTLKAVDIDVPALIRPEKKTYGFVV